MKEEWRDIKGFEGYYKISNLGRILSLPKKKNVNVFNKAKTTTITREKIIKGSKDKDGYVVINLKVGTKLRKFKVHRLVAIAFLIKFGVPLIKSIIKITVDLPTNNQS